MSYNDTQDNFNTSNRFGTNPLENSKSHQNGKLYCFIVFEILNLHLLCIGSPYLGHDDSGKCFKFVVFFVVLKFIPITFEGVGVDVKTSGTTANPAEQAYPGITPYHGDDTGKWFFFRRYFFSIKFIPTFVGINGGDKTARPPAEQVYSGVTDRDAGTTTYSF